MGSRSEFWLRQWIFLRKVGPALLISVPVVALLILIDAVSGTLELIVPNGIGIEVPAKLAPLAGAGLGALVVALVWWGTASLTGEWVPYTRHEMGPPPRLSSIAVVLVCLGILVVAAVRVDEISYTRAALLLVFGATAVGCAGRAMALLDTGQQMELQSEWGGIGGGLGGWRLSPVAGMALIAIVSSAAMAAVALSSPDDRGDKGAKADAAKPVAKSSSPAPVAENAKPAKAP